MSVFRQTLLSAVAEGGERPAVIEDLDTFSYALLEHWSSALARTIAEAPRTGEECAALLLPNGAPWLAAYLAVLKAGLVAVPLNPALTDAEVGRILERTRPRVLLCSPEREQAVRRLPEALQPQRLRVHVVGPTAPDLAGATGAPASRPFTERDPNAPCLVMHTSGTTGLPKAVVQTEQALHLATGYWRHQHRRADDVVALPIPMAHTYGHLAATATLLAGAALLVTPDAFDPVRWTARIARHRATVLEAVPTVYTRLLSDAAFPAPTVRLRRCLSAGQQAPAELRGSWQERTGLPLLESWGMTELAGPGLGPLPGTCPGSSGTPVPGLGTRLVSPTDGTEIAAGEVGELWVRGPQVTPGHRVSTWNILPVCDDRGWLRTGDLARRDTHGCVTLTGRTKDVIITRGYTVHPAEVEEALREHPCVAEAAVVSRADPERGEIPHAVIVTRQGRSASAEDLIAHCRSRLARYKVPRTVDFVPQLPLSATGKLDRAALRGPSATVAVKEG